MLLQLALSASLLLAAGGADVLTSFAEGPDSHPEEALPRAPVEGPRCEPPLPLPAEVPAPPPPPAVTNVDWVVIGSVIGTLGTGLLVALGSMCAVGECENASGDGQAPMIIITAVGSGMVIGGVVLLALGAPPPKADERASALRPSLRLSPTSAALQLQF